jgi:allophanate hydrolase subunit 1
VTGRSGSAVTLRALEGDPLADASIERMIVATARAIAERQGIEVLDLATSPSSITVGLDAGRVEALGFAAELRRLTTNWYTAKYGKASLWGEPDRHDASEADWWKHGTDGEPD